MGMMCKAGLARDEADADDQTRVYDCIDIDDLGRAIAKKRVPILFNQMSYNSRTKKPVSAFPNVGASGPGIPDLPRVSYGGRF